MIISIWGPPQSGKTTISCELAKMISNSQKRVLLISCEDYAQLPFRFGVSPDEGHTILNAYKTPSSLPDVAIQINDNLSLLSPLPHDYAFSAECLPEQATGILEAAESHYECVIVDCTTWKANALTGKAIAKARHLIVPLPASVMAQGWMEAHAAIFKQHVRPCLYVVNATAPNFNYEALLDNLRIPPIGGLPYIPEYYLYENEAYFAADAVKSDKAAWRYCIELTKLADTAFFNDLRKGPGEQEVKKKRGLFGKRV